MRRTILSLVAVTVVVVTSGCANLTLGGSKLDKAAFGQNKKFAVVSISAFDQIIERGAPGMGTSLTGLVDALTQDADEINVTAQDLLNDSVDDILSEAGKSQSFSLLPAKMVMQNKAYRKLPSEPVTRKMGISSITVVPAKGYTIPLDNNDLGNKTAQLAKDLGVDGVIFINVTYMYGFSGMNLAAVVSTGTQKPMISLSVSAYGRNGDVIWQDVISHNHDEGVSSSGASVNLKALRPHFKKAVSVTMNELIAKLDKEARS